MKDRPVTPTPHNEESMSQPSAPERVPVLWFDRNGCGPDLMLLEPFPFKALMDGDDMVAPESLGLRVRAGDLVILGRPMIDGGFYMEREQVEQLHRGLGAWLASNQAGAAPIAAPVPRPAERDDRQSKVFAWAQAAFSVDQATSLPQRGLRLLEEAVEAFQSVGGDPAQAHQLVDFVFSRPVGELGQELGGISVCLLALAAAAGMSADAEEQREVARVLAKPLEEFQRRNAAKNAAGFLAKIPTPADAPVCSTCSDTHRMPLGDREVPCTRCPVPCESCRTRPQGAYCETTPCVCSCHAAGGGR